MPTAPKAAHDPVKTALDSLKAAETTLRRQGGVEVADACKRARREIEPVISTFYAKQGWVL